MLHGVLAAALTPLRDGGSALDADAIPPYVDYLAAGGVDGVLVVGTTGEGLLLSVDERRRVTEPSSRPRPAGCRSPSTPGRRRPRTPSPSPGTRPRPGPTRWP